RSKKILVVDDEKKIVKVVRGYLEQAGFDVVTASNGQQALTVFRHEKPSFVLLDLGLPEIDGLDVARTLRKESSVPIIMVTARIEETDRLIGLELGADDYILKPFSPREVVARVRAVLRRLDGVTASAQVFHAGELTLDLSKHSVTMGNESVELTPTEFDVLAVLMQNPGQAFTRMQLLDRVQGQTYEGYERTIDAHIKNLRQKIGDDPQAPRYILTVFGVGYKFAEDV
ncbi:MAG: response regulator transcription factor, partial [Chloroflexi bacterium]|nr:response regulator transcription factor [Chloroflexota bacterium]